MTTLLAVILIIGVIAFASYWISISHHQSVTVNAQASMRVKVAALLESAQVHASQAEIDSVAAVLVKSKTTATAADRAKVAQELEE
jgi:succinate dehydrogenase hydrophobic anchor subunit